MLRIRPFEYRGQSGFVVTGTNTAGRRVSIFCPDEATARLVRDAVRFGRDDRVPELLARKENAQ